MIQERKGIKMGQDLVLYYFTQITLAIDYIHAMKILHRDIKTQNIFLNRKMTIVKVGDFGISKVIGWEWEVTGRHLIVGAQLKVSPGIHSDWHAQLFVTRNLRR